MTFAVSSLALDMAIDLGLAAVILLAAFTGKPGARTNRPSL